MRSIFCLSWVGSNLLWSVSSVTVFMKESDYFWVTVSLICFNSHYVSTKSVNAAINCNNMSPRCILCHSALAPLLSYCSCCKHFACQSSTLFVSKILTTILIVSWKATKPLQPLPDSSSSAKVAVSSKSVCQIQHFSK